MTTPIPSERKWPDSTHLADATLLTALFEDCSYYDIQTKPDISASRDDVLRQSWPGWVKQPGQVDMWLGQGHVAAMPRFWLLVFSFGMLACKPAAQLRAGDPAQAREAMVATQIAAREIRDPRVLAAMRAVPRHEFVPAEMRALAYEDRPLPIGYEQTISQPYIVAFMTEQLAPRPGQRVLEVGTGSGYQAAVLAQLGAEVFSIEIVEPLAKRAAADLARLGWKNVQVRAGDGYLGWPDAAPFDAIIVTCAPDHVPEPLTRQLKDGGRMIIPVGEFGAQRLVVLEKRGGKIEQRAVLPVRFVPMTGKAQSGGK